MATMALPGKNGSTEYLTQEEETANLLDAVERIGPIITAHSDEADKERRLSRPVRDAMADAGLFRLLTPRSLGGSELPPLDYARVLEAVSSYDSAAGWSLANPLAFAYRCAWLPDDGAEEIMGSGHDVLIAASINPPIKAVPVEGGYRLTGRAPFVSNCHDATWFGVSAIVMDGEKPLLREDGKPETILAYMPMETCDIIETWSVMGMRGTGSDDVEVSDLFVPSHRTFGLPAGAQRGSHYQSPLYRFPFLGMAVGGVALAIARNAIDEVSALAQGKTPLTSKTLLRDKASTQWKIAQAEAAVRSARALRNETIDQVWESTVAGNTPTLGQRADLLLSTVNAVSSSVAAVEMMFQVAGTSGFQDDSPLQRHFRDIQVLKQHAYASEARYQSFGEVFLGLTSDFPSIQ